jgi:uncharacterized paraquat-inducible protein A
VTVASGPPRASLQQRLSASSESSTYKFLANASVVVMFVACAMLHGLLLEGNYELVSFHMEGLVGLVANEGWREFDLLTAAWNMPKNTHQVHGARVLSAIYVAIILVVPICILLVAAFLWLFPLHIRPQRRMLLLFPFWFSWCALDVLLVTSAAAYLEMHLIAEFTFDKKFHMLCTGVKDVLGTSCVNLGHELGMGMYLLGACSVSFLLFTALIARLGNNLLETASSNLSFDR